MILTKPKGCIPHSITSIRTEIKGGVLRGKHAKPRPANWLYAFQVLSLFLAGHFYRYRLNRNSHTNVSIKIKKLHFITALHTKEGVTFTFLLVTQTGTMSRKFVLIGENAPLSQNPQQTNQRSQLFQSIWLIWNTVRGILRVWFCQWIQVFVSGSSFKKTSWGYMH